MRERNNRESRKWQKEERETKTKREEKQSERERRKRKEKDRGEEDTHVNTDIWLKSWEKDKF